MIKDIYQLKTGFTPTLNFLQSKVKSLPFTYDLASKLLYRLNNRRKQSLQQENWCRGFTLLELLIYLAITSVVGIVISTVGLSLLNLSTKTNVLEEVHYSATIITATLERVTSEAREIQSPDPTQSSSSISFAMYDPAKDPTVISVLNGTAYIKAGAGEAWPLSSTTNVDLIFKNITAESNHLATVNLAVFATSTSPLSYFHASHTWHTVLRLNQTP